jgi:hypothetical protein
MKKHWTGRLAIVQLVQLVFVGEKVREKKNKHAAGLYTYTDVRATPY